MDMCTCVCVLLNMSSLLLVSVVTGINLNIYVSFLRFLWEKRPTDVLFVLIDVCHNVVFMDL